MVKRSAQPPQKRVKVIYRPWITTKDGRRIYAKTYGKKVFRLEIPIE
jgi:hypothetical protein